MSGLASQQNSASGAGNGGAGTLTTTNSIIKALNDDINKNLSKTTNSTTASGPAGPPPTGTLSMAGLTQSNSIAGLDALNMTSLNAGGSNLNHILASPLGPAGTATHPNNLPPVPAPPITGGKTLKLSQGSPAEHGYGSASYMMQGGGSNDPMTLTSMSMMPMPPPAPPTLNSAASPFNPPLPLLGTGS